MKSFKWIIFPHQVLFFDGKKAPYGHRTHEYVLIFIQMALFGSISVSDLLIQNI